MIRAITLVLMLTGCSSGCSLSGSVPAHAHMRAEIGLSCAETCAPWDCSASYGISEQATIACEDEAKTHALCVCQVPVSE